MIKYIVIYCILLVNNAVFGQITQINSNYCNLIVNSIYKIEGGSNTKWPFGIKSINTNGNKEKSRAICTNTVKNNYIRWQNAGKTNEFLLFLCNVYCPASVDPKGNSNWFKNIKKLVDGAGNKM